MYTVYDDVFDRRPAAMLRASQLQLHHATFTPNHLPIADAYCDVGLFIISTALYSQSVRRSLPLLYMKQTVCCKNYRR